MLKQDAKLIITISLVAVATHAVAPQWCDWLMSGVLGKCLKGFFVFMTDYQCINIILACVFLFCGGCWAWRILQDRDIRLYRLALLMWAWVVLFDKNTLETASILGKWDYKDLTVTIGLGVMLVMACKVVDRFFPYIERVRNWLNERREKCSSETAKANSSGFPNDDIAPQKTPKALQQYAEVIAEQLLGTNLTKHSFAVGITGEWGSGKTTFLDLLESKLKSKAEIVSFNPWMCRTPEQVTDDFFATLQQQLSPRHSSLSKPIRDYANYITNATLSWGHVFLSKLTFSFPQESLQEKKKRLSERFALLNKPVVVLIDDLDRLESSEVFEVLRLIRNTADLRNTIYVVAYDKEYVTHVLKRTEIKDSAAYLEKIFPVEVHQPKVEDYQIIQVLYGDLKRINLINGKFADELLKRIKPQDKQLIVKILGNYRQTRRFIRVYSLNVLYIQKVFTNEIKLTDLFWMELLQMYDKEVYDLLSREPSMFLYVHDRKYCLRPGIKKGYYVGESEKLYEYKGETKWAVDTPYILELLFGRYSENVTESSICYIENFEKYFTLGVSPYKLSKLELHTLFIKSGEEEKIVKGWIDDGKYFSSITYQFEKCKVKDFDNKNLKTFIKAVLSFGLTMGEYGYDVGLNVHALLEKQRFKSQQIELGKNVVLGWFDEKVGKGQSLKALTRLLNRLYVSTEYDENGKKQTKTTLIIDNSDVVRLLKKAMGVYLKQHPDVTALSIFNEKSEIGIVFGNCCVQTDESILSDEFSAWENVAIDIVVNHFKESAKMPIEDQKEAINKMFMDDIPVLDEDGVDPEMQEWYDNAWENRSRSLDAFFGSATEPFKKMIEACFTQDNTNDSGNSDASKQNKKKHDKNTKSKPAKRKKKK